MGYTLLNQFTGTDKVGEQYILKVGGYFVGLNDDGRIQSYDTQFKYLEPREAVVFKTKKEADSMHKTINGVPIIAAGEKIKAIKINKVCDIYYTICVEKDVLSIGTAWHLKGKNRTIYGRFKSSAVDNYEIERFTQFFSLDNYDEFCEKLKEVKLELTNKLHKKLISIMQVKPDNPYNPLIVK